MKRVRCPKCDHFITFDETQYPDGQTLVFTCPDCDKQFGIRLGKSKLFDKGQKTAHSDKQQMAEDGRQAADGAPYCGNLVVIENVFHYKQVIPLRMGDNVIGRYQKSNPINCPIETVDPSMDMTHCVITVCRDKKGNLRHILRDGPSNTGTFVDNNILQTGERRYIEDGTLFTIGATSVILKTTPEE